MKRILIDIFWGILQIIVYVMAASIPFLIFGAFLFWPYWG